MNKLIPLSGQWIGFFTYGPEYGEEMHGEKVQFRLFLEDINDGPFRGKCVDTEGKGSDFNTSIINGFLEDNLISFSKEYSEYYIIDENGHTIQDTHNPTPRLHYSGEYYQNTKSFSGKWEMWANERLEGDGSVVDIFTGDWEMYKSE